jgi:hypothetical protein
MISSNLGTTAAQLGGGTSPGTSLNHRQRFCQYAGHIRFRRWGYQRWGNWNHGGRLRLRLGSRLVTRRTGSDTRWDRRARVTCIFVIHYVCVRERAASEARGSTTVPAKCEDTQKCICDHTSNPTKRCFAK